MEQYIPRVRELIAQGMIDLKRNPGLYLMCMAAVHQFQTSRVIGISLRPLRRQGPADTR